MSKKLSNLENKYYYGFTRSIWHIVITVLFLGLIVGIAVIGWSYIPNSKKQVVKAQTPVKQSYPKQADVTAMEVLQRLPKENKEIKKILDKETKIANTPSNEEKVIVVKVIDTVSLNAFNNEIANLKLLVPVKQNSDLWNPKGHYSYPEGERKYVVTKNDKYRKWVVTAKGLKENIIANTDRIGFKSYKDKYELIKAYNNCLEKIDAVNRKAVLLKLLRFYNTTKTSTIETINQLAILLPLFKDNLEQVFDNETYFIKKNPRDGLDMIVFEAKILPSFSVEDRIQTAKVLKSEYLNHYDNNLTGFKENTQNFLQMLPKFSNGQEALALQYYYDAYRSKNAQRVADIRAIENNYQNEINAINQQYQVDLRSADQEYNSTIQNKTFWRSKSFKVVCASILSVLVVTLILLILSMIRNVNKLANVLLLQKENDESSETKSI